MTGTDALGWAAAALTLLTFISGDMMRLRVLALAANGAFISYGLMAGLAPVLVLHLTLLPINLWRLLQLWQRWRDSARTDVQAVLPLPAPPIAAGVDSPADDPARGWAHPQLSGCASALRRSRAAGRDATEPQSRRFSRRRSLAAGHHRRGETTRPRDELGAPGRS